MPVKPIVTDTSKLSVPCNETTLEDARSVIQDLMDTAHHHKKHCAGLAANQIGSDLRVIVVKIKGKFVAFINPTFTPAGAKIDSTEGCLSFPGKKATVKRYKAITTSPSKGKRKKQWLGYIEAIAFQHECDHLNGKCI